MNVANPKLYGILGLILVAIPMLIFFFAGMPYAGQETRIDYINHTITTTAIKTEWKGAFNPYMFLFIFLAVIATLGCYRSILMAWVGSILLLILSILTGFTVGLFALPGTMLLLVGAILKTLEQK